MRRLQAASSHAGESTRWRAQASAHRVRSTRQGASIALRLRVLFTHGKLDRQIVAGAPVHPVSDAQALRFRQLTDRVTRRQIARELRRVVEYADSHGSAPVISCVVVERVAVRAGRESILGLAERLEADAPVTAAGIVLARALLTDGVSPLHNPQCRQTVSEAIFALQDALGA